MAWDTEKTKTLLLDAATAEFSTFGLAGARVDRIAATAGVNKERIYQYFGKKDDLFGIVLARQLAAVMSEIAITGKGVDAVVDYAGRVFDYQAAHPELARLTFWEGLERDEPTALETRIAGGIDKVRRLREALPDISEDDARELLLTVLTLCDGWQVLRNMDRVYTGTVERTAARDAARRRAVLATVEAYTRELVG
ncbi:TetR family transcriptional regulator [Glaciihabitans arcticus]|uniref:TetR family transcriptional regulator n=1 Tax=Glaciihabitans arcticus TaxID=2668039 RepID=A0A4Q9GRT5_9MICO|nr:TetR family transcriptional regulator [Glaciihabitans arcticus]TBN57361.1 TetR family transcriptional regulator [Glaciihabitans arcticus]